VPRTCTVCAHEEREAIDEALVLGESFRNIVKHRGLSITALHRHRRDHLSPTLVAVAQGRRESEAESLLDRVEDLYDRARRILEAAEEDGRPAVGLSAIRELRGIVELLGKVTGELDDRPSTTINLLVSPEWLAVRKAILEVLGPEARALVAERLEALEAAT